MKDGFERRTNGQSKFSFVVVAAAMTLLLAPASSRADFNVANIFGDHMILQRGVAVPVWGRADPGSEITVRMAERSATAKTGPDGVWRAELPAMAAGGPYEITISGPASIVLKNVLVGDVWLCVGDAGMQKMAGQVPVATQILARLPATLRTFVPGTQSTSTPAPDLSRRTGWSMGTHPNSQYFSAIGLAFADELRGRLESKDIPIGLIQIIGPNTPIEAWSARDPLTGNPETKPLVDVYDQAVASYRKAAEALIPAYKQWRADMDRAEQTGSAWPQAPRLPPEPRSSGMKPCGYFNGVISPLASFPVKGVLWSHGETDVNRAGLYRQIFPMVIQSWRDAWKSPTLPFLFVELGTSGAKTGEAKETAWAALRDAQKAALALPQTRMVSIPDRNAVDAPLQIGRQFAGAAMETAYGIRIR